MIFRVLDPTNEKHDVGGKPAPRPQSLSGRTVGIISNGKEGTKEYFAHVARLLRDEPRRVGEVVLRTKSNFSAPADTHIVDEIRRWQAVVTGVGD